MAVMKFLVYVTCFCLSQDQIFCDVYGESGNEITLTPVIHGKPEEILWRHNDNKVLEYDGSEVEKYGSFKGRVDVDFETGELIIRNLNSQDSGNFHSEILIKGIVQSSFHTLTVLDPLPDPRVTCEVDENSNLKKLTCSMESQTQPSYEWSGPDIKQPGPTLLVNEQGENSNSVYTCTVKDKSRSKTTDFNLQDCHTDRVSLAVIVPVIIVILLLIILLAVLALFLYRRKKQKLGKSGLKKIDLENDSLTPQQTEQFCLFCSNTYGGHCECNKLLNKVPMATAVPGSFEATLPCHTRLTPPKESIADKNWNQDSKSENVVEIHEGQKLLKESPQYAITEKNKDDLANTNGEQDKKEKNSENADEAEENTNSTASETDTEVESQKSLQTQEEMAKSQILKNETEDKEESPEEQTETLGEQDQQPEEKKEKEGENEEMDRPNTAEGELEKSHKNSENAEEAEENANTKGEAESLKSLQTQEEIEKTQIMKTENEEKSPEEQTLGEDTKDTDRNEEEKQEEEENEAIDSLNTVTVSPQSTVTGRSTVNTANVAEQLHKNEKSSQNENGEQSVEQQNKSLCTSVNEDDQRPEREKEEEEKNYQENQEGTSRLHTAEPCNPALQASSDPVDSPSNLDISVPSSSLNMELENKEEEDDDSEQTDKSSESEQGMKDK